MPRKHKRVLGSRPYINWTQENLEKAVNAVKSGAMTIRTAQDEFKIPKSTIHRKIHNLHMEKVGRPTELTDEEEDKLVQGLIILADWGTPLTTFEVRLLVKSYLDAKGQVSKRFKENTPGTEWCYSFLERHKTQLSPRLCSNIKRDRAQVSKEDIKSYFENLDNSIIGVVPECIINFDETNVSDDPGRKKVLARRGSKRVDRVIDHSKSSTSVMFVGTASGKMLPPYIVYKAEHLNSTWITNGPNDARYNRSRSGWFDGVLFENWFDTIILPYCRNLDRERGCPSIKLIIGDNLSSHISLSTIKKCEENNIRFVLLPPNSTHLCQPLDVAVFKSFKAEWRKVLTEWKLKNKGTVSKDRFPSLLKKSLESLGDRMSTNLISGFRASGIYPLDPQAVLKRLPKTNQRDNNSSGELWSQTIVEMLQKTREKDPTVKKRRSKLNVKPGESVSESHFQDLTSGEGPSTSRQRQGPSRRGQSASKKREQGRQQTRQSATINRQDIATSDDDDDMHNDGQVEFIMCPENDERPSSSSEDNNDEEEDPLLQEMINCYQNIIHSEESEDMDILDMDQENEDINNEDRENEDIINEDRENNETRENEDIINKDQENNETRENDDIINEEQENNETRENNDIINEDQENNVTRENKDINNEDRENEKINNEDLENENVGNKGQENQDINDEDKENTNNGSRNILYKKDDFILIKLIYNRGTKKQTEKYFIAQIEEILSNNLTCKFMRKAQKSEHTFIFPVIEDKMQVNESQVVRKLLQPDIRRGRHIFKDIAGVQF